MPTSRALVGALRLFDLGPEPLAHGPSAVRGVREQHLHDLVVAEEVLLESRGREQVQILCGLGTAAETLPAFERKARRELDAQQAVPPLHPPQLFHAAAAYILSLLLER